MNSHLSHPSLFGLAMVFLIGLAACDRPVDERASAAVRKSAASAGQLPEDAIITSLVKAALIASRDINGKDISVATNHGRVTLTGKVPAQQIRRAEEVARDVDGVKDVHNKLRPAGVIS